MVQQILPDGEALTSVAIVDEAGNAVNALNPMEVADQHSSYASPNGNKVTTSTTLDSLFSDDFGGSAVNAITNNWTILDGGLGANPNLGNGTLTQTAIGSGTDMGNGTNGPSNTALSVASSALTVTMGTTNGAELWLLSNQTFAGKEMIRVALSRSQALAANSIFIGLVEIDPVTLCPFLNPNFANEFTNRGGCEFGLTTTSTAFQAEAIGDSSSTKATGAVGVATALTTMQEFPIAIDSWDVIVTNKLLDSVAGASSGASRASSQAPNDKKLYKLVLRFRNVSTPGSSTTVSIGKILVEDNYSNRVTIGEGEGDTIMQNAVPVLLTGGSALAVSLGAVALVASPTIGPNTFHKLISAATTNATSVKTTIGTLSGGSLCNTNADARYFKFYNKASAPAVGTDVPILTIRLLPSVPVQLADVLGAYGAHFTSGIAYAITGAEADTDTTAIGAGDVGVNLIYT